MRNSSFIERCRLIDGPLFAAVLLTALVMTDAAHRSTAHGASTTAPASTATATASTPVMTRHPIAAVRPQPLKPAEYRLVYKFRANEDVYMPLVTESRMVVQKGPATVTTMNQSTVERHIHVVAVEPDGSATVDLFIDNVKLSYAFNNGTPTVYDTSTGDAPPRGFEGVKSSVGPRGRVRFSTRGGVMPLPGVVANPSSDPSESESFFDLLPTKPVHVGDEWFDDIKVQVSVSRTLKQKIAFRRRYTLESVDGETATIRLRTAEITPVEDPHIRAQLVQRAPEGKITFSLERGQIAARDVSCNRTETGIMGEGSQIAATTHWKGTLR
jgi:hypothetical protein